MAENTEEKIEEKIDETIEEKKEEIKEEVKEEKKEVVKETSKDKPQKGFKNELGPKPKKKKKQAGLHSSIPMMTCGPILLFGVLAMILAGVRFSGIMYEKVEGELKEIASSVLLTYDIRYPGEYELVSDGNVAAFYKGEKEITGDNLIIDRYKQETGAEISIFYLDTRVLTTLSGENGESLVGTGANAVVKQAVLEGKESRFYKKVNIYGTDYYVYYEPIKEVSGDVVGMIAIAKTCKEIDRLVTRAISPMIGFLAAFTLLVAFVSFSYTKKLADDIESIQRSLYKITKGDLGGEVEYKVLKRNDEIGDIGKSIRSMQNSLHILVEKDALTELYNRRLANKRLEKAIREEREFGTNYCVALCDIDFFKKVNDTYGHDMGDVVLKEVAKVLRTNMVGNGVASRWGGEEFLLIFTDMNLKTAYSVTQKILNDVRALEIENRSDMTEEELFGEFLAGKKTGEIEIIEDDGSETEQYLQVDDAFIPFIKVTMSIGLVRGGLGRTQDEVVKMADDNLYTGKENGRNQIVCEAIPQEKEDEDEEDI
ncbi:MAG: sensor domain-containing diguanylate cyclase [Lachnospiraceae bacterium]|nr:sensor domain-containing diguanylate cyclase [Lachnospiraceae bacterium]